MDADAYLSEEDLVYAESPIFPFPGAFQIVVSVVGDKVKDAAIFESDPESGGFAHERASLIKAREI